MPAHGISSALFCASPAPPPPPSVVFVHIYPISRPRRLPASNYPTLTPLFRPCYPGGLDSTRVYKCKYKYPTRTPNSRCRGTREQSALVMLIRFHANLYSQLPNIAFVSLNSTHYSLCVCPIQTPPPTPYSSFCTKMILWTAVIGVFTFIVSLTPVAANSPISVSYRRRPPAAGRLLTTCTVS